MNSQRPASSACRKCSRVSLGLLNFVFFVIGCLFIAAGAIVKTNFESAIFHINTTYIDSRDAQDIQEFAKLAPSFLIGIGCFMISVSVLGCAGSCFDKRILLIIYCSLIVLVVACEVSLGGYALAKKEGFGQIGADLVNSGFQDSRSRPLFDLICNQRGLASDKSHFTCDASLNATQISCANCVEQVLNENTNYVGAALIAIGCIEIIALMLACCSMPTETTRPFVRVESASGRSNQPGYISHQNQPSRSNAQHRMPL